MELQAVDSLMAAGIPCWLYVETPAFSVKIIMQIPKTAMYFSHSE